MSYEHEKWKNLHKEGNLSVGMWPGGTVVYFTFVPDEDEQEVEFLVAVKKLKQIVEDAEKYAKGE